jgi:uncharacterized membrane protein YedE/YeeE
MRTNRPDLAALGFCGVVVIAVSLLALQGAPVPDFLPSVGMFVAGGGLGVALNTGQQSAPADTGRGYRRPAPAPRAEAPAPPPAPARPLDDFPLSSGLPS